jgi:hypothetical protein
MKRIVLACVSRMYPAFCTVTASGLFMRPSASSLFCFYGFQKIFSRTLRTERGRKDSPNLPQMQSFGTREHGPSLIS